MTKTRRLLLVTLLSVATLGELLGGCVYYNGMYNANRLARSARKAEREGRTFDANGFWGQVATKAESVLVRHPTSRYAGEASLLRGVALARLGQCEQALGPLSRASVANIKRDLAEDALLASGRCQLLLGNLVAADAAFAQLLDSRSADRRSEARFQHARLLRQIGRYQDALAALSGLNDSRAQAERVLALAGVGRVPEAMALADSLMARGDTTKRWDSLVVILARENPPAASSLLDRTRRLPNRTKELQAKMLLEDGQRMVKIDTARAARRFRETQSAGGTGEAAGRASLALLQLQLTQVNDPAALVPLLDTLELLARRYAIVVDELSRFGETVADVHSAALRVTPDSLQGDLRLFLAAESARDALAAPRLAETMFRRIAEQWPSSPYAPKAILAAQQLNPAWVDSGRVLLDQLYSDSPYLWTIRGEATAEYRQLEDSLGAFAASLAVAKPGAPRRRPLAPDAPGQRPPQPSSGGSKIPEPQ